MYNATSGERMNSWNNNPVYHTAVGRIMTLSLRCLHPNPRICEYVILHGIRDFAKVIKVRILKQGDYPGLLMWAQCNLRNPCKREAGGSEEKRCDNRSIERYQDAVLLTLKIEEVVTSQGMQVASRNQRKQGKDSSLKPLEGMKLC